MSKITLNHEQVHPDIQQERDFSDPSPDSGDSGVADTDTDTVPAPLFPMALDVLCFSDKQYALMREHKFGKAFMKLSAYLISNHHVNTGSIHRVRPSELASRVGVALADVYTFKNTVNKIGLMKLHISKMKLTGKVLLRPKQRLAEPVEIFNDMRVAMIHRDGVRLLIENDAPCSAWHFAIASAFHCHVATGELHEKHPTEWSDLIGKFRTTVTRTLDFLNRIEFLETKTDYTVSGKLPWTAYARSWFEQWHIAQAKMEAGVSEMRAKLDFVTAVKWLRDGYGFCVEFLNNSSKVMAAAKALRWKKPGSDKDVSADTRSFGYYLNEDGSKHWTDKAAFEKAVNGGGAASAATE
ncbi:hypothetical protein J5I95_13720 [Candidatus Poribacteria bacterium]|nr:hypothetical protein [Candidatus Poribacteria bacterium]